MIDLNFVIRRLLITPLTDTDVPVKEIYVNYIAAGRPIRICIIRDRRNKEEGIHRNILVFAVNAPLYIRGFPKIPTSFVIPE
jgi:hypothetical protein